ncbi:response regulator [Nostoc sp. CENA67]|uniref:histidine kinase n=1 Tax=Amazonocrinis nigriterrae CENA67 TaxID=2794033 RepID=A0A8J7HW06_9NOST|nr:ATP-binding protein [Amazonocrinis nigriterrae]MBH8566907.1 response regulator [Amazonocrinis nigriterrae CENA67]
MPDTWTLLTIDDCAADRKIYRRFLMKDPHQSYQVWEADCAEDGIALCQEMHFDVILLDFCLPDMSGLELLKKLKQEIFRTPVSVIVLTGRGDEEVAVQAMKMGAMDYLVKQQLKPDVLQLAVRNATKQLGLQAQLNKTQERQRLIATTALRIRQSLDLEQILNTAVAEVQQLLKCDRVMVYQFAPDNTGKIVASSAQSCDVVLLGDRIDIQKVATPTPKEKPKDQVASLAENRIPHLCYEETAGGTEDWCLETKDWVAEEAESNYSPLPIPNSPLPIPNSQFPISSNRAISYVYEAGLSNCYDRLTEQFHTKAHLVVPINLNNNGKPTPKPWGLLIAYHSIEERQWQADDVEMLYEVSVQLAIAIQQAELLTQTQTALQKEKQLNAFRSQIIGTVSHECRTPLTSILAAASTLVKYRYQLDESKQERFMQIIEQKARYMSKLVDNMLLVNQFELDKAKFKPIPLDLLQFFSDLIEQEQETLGERHEVIFKITGNYKGFWGDRGLLQQIFVNLMSNAIKYSPNGGIVEFHLMGKESQVMFHIQDQGIGIPIADQKNLFQSFSRGSNVDTIPGTGLGLAIAKACVELHGGDITLFSQLGQGTKVTVSLPKRLPTGS